MPLRIQSEASTLLIRRQAFEATGLTRADVDRALTLTDQEFRVEGDLIAIGPVYDVDALGAFVLELEGLGLTFFDDLYELSGNWPGWLAVFAMAAGQE